MQGRFHQQVQADDLQRMLQYRSGQDALRAGNYPLAWQSFESSFRHHPFAGQDATILLLLRSLLKVGNDDPRAPLLRAGLARLAARS
jgi:outer membrane protein assembly factor BamD (BamD/ComL family)